MVLYHTYLGGFLVNTMFTLSWTLGGALVGVSCAMLSDFTHGLSFGIFGVVAMESRKARMGWSMLFCSLCAYLGPRSSATPGFGRFWLSWASLFAMSLETWFVRFRRRPGFIKWVQDMDATKYYKDIQLRGALQDIEKENSIFGFHPHGILCLGFSFNGCWNKQFRDLAGTDTAFLADKVLVEDNPFFSVLCEWHGTIRVLTKKIIFKWLKEKKNIAFVPGGFEDATAMKHGAHRTVMKKRTGFIKYALQHGCRVHPCWTFGESDSHYTYTGLLKFRLWLNKFGIPAVIVFGNPLLPLLPRPQTSVLTYIGKPILLPKIDDPTKEDVQKWHAEYLKGLVQVFDENKKEAGLPDTAKLEIW